MEESRFEETSITANFILPVPLYIRKLTVLYFLIFRRVDWQHASVIGRAKD